MIVRTSVDSRALVLKLKNGQRKLAYAVANGINDAAKRLQSDTKAEVQEQFNLRGKGGAFVLRQAAIIRPFASAKQGRPYAELSVGRKNRLLLSQFDKGGERKPFVGKSVAVPLTGSAARPSEGESVVPALRMKALKFKKDKAGTRWTGLQRTYLVPGVGVFQRYGPGPRDSRLIYAFDTDVQLPAAVPFTRLWQRGGERYLNAAIDDRIKRELLRR